MPDEYITRHEHEEFMRTMESENRRIIEENDRQNRRLIVLEDGMKQVIDISRTLERLATNMESLAKELEKQGKHMEILEGRDGEKWRQVVGYLLSAIVSGAICFLLAKIGLK